MRGGETNPRYPLYLCGLMKQATKIHVTVPVGIHRLAQIDNFFIALLSKRAYLVE